jgi:purine-nucleoside phosphorylase
LEQIKAANREAVEACRVADQILAEAERHPERREVLVRKARMALATATAIAIAPPTTTERSA